MNTGKNPKSYNNEVAWIKIEQADLKRKNSKNQYINVMDDKINFDDAEFIEVDQSYESPKQSNSFDEVMGNQDYESTSPKEDFDEVLQLTEYDGGGSLMNGSDFVVAEYNKVDVQNIDEKQKIKAEKFVNKITKFVLEFNDVKLTADHEDYIRQVGELQLSNLQDLLSLVEINKQMIGNIVARVNAVQAEDYAIINAYNNLVNQHIKLIKEVSNTYKSIPSVIKKMRADVLSNQELEAATENEEVITEEFGDKQFNNSKQMLKAILAKRKAKSEQEEQSE